MKQFNPILFAITAYSLWGSVHLEALATNFLASNAVIVGLVVTGSRSSRSSVECGAFCNVDPNCFMMVYSQVSEICSLVSKNGSNESVQLSIQEGAVKFVDISQPCKFKIC